MQNVQMGKVRIETLHGSCDASLQQKHEKRNELKSFEWSLQRFGAAQPEYWFTPDADPLQYGCRQFPIQCRTAGEARPILHITNIF